MHVYFWNQFCRMIGFNMYSITYKDNPVTEEWHNHLGIYYLDGDPIGSTLTQTIGQILSIFWEGLSVEGDSSIIRQEIGVQKNPGLWLQRVLHIGHTASQNKTSHLSIQDFKYVLCIMYHFIFLYPKTPIKFGYHIVGPFTS